MNSNREQSYVLKLNNQIFIPLNLSATNSQIAALLSLQSGFLQ